jgi:hypothetical protein
MPELRWALIGLGLLFLGGLALWEWRKSRRRHFTNAHVESSAVIEPGRPREPVERTRRVEPSIDGISAADADPDMVFEVPTIHPVEPVRVALSAGAAVDIPSAARFDLSIEEPERAQVPIQWPPRESTRVLGLRVVNARGDLLSGRTLRIALDAAGLRHGPQRIYHLVTADGAVLVSVANLMRPGALDPAVIDGLQLKGLNVFSVLPGPLPPEQMLEGLVQLARTLAQRLGAVVHDSSGQELDEVLLAALRQSVDEGP